MGYRQDFSRQVESLAELLRVVWVYVLFFYLYFGDFMYVFEFFRVFGLIFVESNIN